MQMSNFEQVHLCTFALPSELFIAAIICWGDIIIGLIATFNAFMFTLYCRKKLIL